MRASDEGLRSEALRAALQTALSGKPDQLEALFCRYGGGPDPRPNLKLAAAFGTEIAAYPGAAAPLLARLAAEDAAPDTREVFLPMAAVYGWTARVREQRDTDAGWGALLELAGDERDPVRVAALNALLAFAERPRDGRQLVARALDWLETPDQELRWSAAALVIEVLGERRVMVGCADDPALLTYLTRTIDQLADAPRSAERSAARRRLIGALPRTLRTVVSTVTAAQRGVEWLEAECVRAQRPDVRAALSDTIVRLRDTPPTVVLRLRQALEGSAKPLRDPSRIRPGTGRGKATRRLR